MNWRHCKEKAWPYSHKQGGLRGLWGRVTLLAEYALHTAKLVRRPSYCVWLVYYGTVEVAADATLAMNSRPLYTRQMGDTETEYTWKISSHPLEAARWWDEWKPEHGLRVAHYTFTAETWLDGGEPKEDISWA